MKSYPCNIFNLYALEFVCGVNVTHGITILKIQDERSDSVLNNRKSCRDNEESSVMH